MFADRGVLRVCKIASAAAGWAILPGLLAVVLLSSSAAFADDPPWDRWWRVEKPSKEECDAAREWDKATDAWIDLCGEGRDKQSAPKAPPMEQQLAAEAEKRCIEENAKDRDAYEACLTNARLAIFPAAAAENRCIENVKDHEAYEACLTNVRLKIILANSPAIQAQCSRRTGDDLIDCVDLIYVYGGRLKDMLAANLKQVSLKEWGKQVEEEWQARKADPERRKQSGSQCGGPGGAGQRWQVNGNELHGCPCGYGLKPTPGAFGAWSCQKLGTILLAPDKTDNPQDDSPDSGGSGSPAGNDPAANTDAPPINRFDVRVPEKSAPSVSLPGASPTNRPTVPVPGAPRANTPTATAAPPRPGVPKGVSTNPQSTITGTNRQLRGIRSYDSKQSAIVASDGRKVNIRPFISALEKVSPAAARNPFISSSGGGGLRFSPAVQQTLVQSGGALRAVGGVELDVTFQQLAMLGVAETRVNGPATMIEDPVMISLRGLVAAAKPYASDWRSLPEDVRYPGGLGRVHGYVLDPHTKDVFIVGTAAKTPETRLDIDLITVMMDTVWEKELIPGVSIDPAPASPSDASSRKPGITRGQDWSGVDFSQPMHARIINIPPDALVSRIMLDADYQMKQINHGRVKVDDPTFKSQVDMLKSEKSGDLLPRTTRWWLYPIPLSSSTVRVSGSGRTVLYDAGVQLLTEDMIVERGHLAGTGQVDPIAERVAAEFTRAYRNIESSPAVRPPGVFALLHGITDIVTMCKILHDSEVDYPVLHELARLPYRQLSGAEAVPSTYPSETLKFTTADGKTRVLQGGVTLRSRPTRRSIDRFDDEVVATLEQAVRHFGDGRFVHRVPLTFTLPTQLGDTDNPATILAKATAVLARDTGVRLLRQNLPKSASERLREATLKDPLDIDAWIYLALAEARAGNDLQARSALEQAQALDPQDPLVNSVAAQLAYLADPSSLGAFGQVERRELSNEYVEKAFGAIDRPARTAHTGIHENSAFENAEIAIKIWPDNAQAYVIRGLLFAKYYKSVDLAVQDYDKGIRLDPKNALALVSRAEAYAAKDNYDQAIADCDEAIRIDPNNPRVFYIRGNSYQSKKKSNYPRAITDYTEAIRLDPAYIEARKARARASRVNGYYDLAIEDYTRLIASGDATYKDRAEVYVHAGDFDRAINDYNEVLRARPADASVMDLRGDAYRKKGDLDQAIADYTEAIRLEPNADFSYESRAEVWREKGDLDRGIADYTAAIQVGKRGWEKDYLRRAELWAEKGDLNRALEDYSEARRVDPTSYIARAKFWLGQGRFDRAVAEYTEVIRTDPASGYYNRAHLWRRYRNLDRAIADYTEAIKLAPGKGYYYENRAEVREEKGDISNALADYNEIIRIAPADGYYQRAQFWRRQGKLDQAIADLTEAARLKPTYWPYYSSRARVWKEKGDLEHAIADYAAAIRVDPENALPYNTRAEFWLERGDPDRAVADYDEAIRVDPRWDSYAGRAAAWEQKGELDRAIADSSEAIRRRPNSAAGAFKTRGDAYRKKGREDLAAADYRQAAKIYGHQGRAYFNANPWTGGGWRGQFTGASEFFFKSNQIDQNDYTTLWLYLARARTDKPFNVASVAAHLNTQAWPYPIIDFYLGKRGPEGVLSASANPAQDCEARFYVGEWYLLHSNTAEAKSMLRSAVESCPKRSDTYQGAAAELIRIEASGAR